jgi:hypothetical protein
MATGNWGDPSYGAQYATPSPAGQGTNDPLRQQNVYEYGANDTPSSWAQRVWGQSTADYGRNDLNPYVSQNPTATSPYAKWYQSRFGTSAPTNLFTMNLTTGTPMTADTVAGQLKGMQTNQAPATSLTGNDINYEKNTLQNVGGMLKKFNSGDNSGLNTSQIGMLGQLQNDPSLSTQMIMSGLQGGMGGWGMNYIGNQLANLTNAYYNDPAQMGPQSKGGPFFNQALSLLGMGVS